MRKILIENLDYQTTPGVHSVLVGGCLTCKTNNTRGTNYCANCTDKQLLELGIDIVKGGSQFAYERVNGKIQRKIK